MAIIATHKIGNATVHIDDAYLHCTEEEMARRKKEVQDVVTAIYYSNPEVRKHILSLPNKSKSE